MYRLDPREAIVTALDGLLPNADTVTEIRKVYWEPAVDARRLLTYYAYHLLRRWHGLEPLTFLGQQIALIRDDPDQE